MSLDLAKDFPGYPTTGIYLDSATVGLVPRYSLDRQYEFMTSLNYTVRKALHKRASDVDEAYYDAKHTFGSYFGLDQENLAWIASADIAVNLVIYSLIQFVPRNIPRVITTVFEHHSIIVPLLNLSSRNKIDLIILSEAEENCMIEFIENKAIEHDIIILGHNTPVLGLYRPIDEISRAIRSKGGYTVVDFSRSAGQAIVSTSSTDIAIFDGTRDLLGPPGSGYLYISNNLLHKLDNPFPSSGNVGRVSKHDFDQIKGIEKFEVGSPQVDTMVGLSSSVQYLESIGKDKIIQHRKNIMDAFVERLQELSWLNVVDPFLDSYCDQSQRSSIITLQSTGHPHDLAILLDEQYDIQIRSGLFCAHPSVTELELNSVFQISTHVYNTLEEVDRFVDSLEKTHQLIY